MKPKPHPLSTPRKPAGQPTRGKTASNRLRRVDNFITRYDPGLLSRMDSAYKHALFVDLGYGAEPFTTLESATRFRRLNPALHVLGIEIDAVRVESAKPYADERTHFRLGGFNLPLQQGVDGQPESVRLIRAFNVLRQYEETQVAEAYALMAPHVLPGGLLIEGTSDPYGRIWVAHVMRRASLPNALHQTGERGFGSEAWVREALVLSTNFRSGFDPGMLQTVLPKNLIHHMVASEPIYNFFQTWKRATLETGSMRAWGARQWFVASAQRLSTHGYHIDLRLHWLRQGYLIVYGF
jgi:hypothetical protein